MKPRIAVVLLAAGLSACGGGSGGVVTSNVGTSSPTNSAALTGSIVTTIDVPGGSGTQSTRRAPEYVSASTLGLKVTVTDIPPTGVAASFTAITSVYALGIGFNQIVIPTPASATGHSEDLTYVAYNAAPVANAIPAGAKALAYGLTTGFVAVPGQNTNNVVLAGVADNYPAPLAESGAFGMMSSAPPALNGVQTSFGFGGNVTPSGIATLNDAGGNDITTSAGNPWPIVGSVPPTAITPATGVPVTIAETAGTCGATSSPPHLQLSYNGGAFATTAAITATNAPLEAVYDGNGGVGWYAIVSAKAQTQTLAYTLSSLGVTAIPNPSNTSDWSCANQTLSFSNPNEKALMTIVEHVAATPYTITEPNTPSCTGLINAYVGNSTLPANLITPGVATSLGAGTTFTVQLIASPAGYYSCNIEIQDNNSASTGGPTFPGATSYVQAQLPSNETFITVP